MQHNDQLSENFVLGFSGAPGPRRDSQLPAEGDPLPWIIETMRRNAPILSFHADEKYLTWNVPDYLQNVQLFDARGTLLARPPLTPKNLPLGRGSQSTYLAIPDGRDGIKGGDLQTTRVYCHALRWTHGEFSGADFQYFFFYPYNGPGYLRLRFPGLNKDFEIPAGAHQGDWESIIVRTDANGNVLGIYCNQHGSGRWYSPGELQWRDGHPVIFVALSGHPSFDSIGHFPTEKGDFTVSFLGITVGAQLDNVTGNGVQFPTADAVDLVSTSFFDGVHVEEPWWLNYLGRYGLVVFTERDKDNTASTIASILKSVKVPGGIAEEIARRMADKVYSILGEIEPDGPEAPRNKGWWDTIRSDGPWINVSRRWAGNWKISSMPGYINPTSRDNLALAAFGDRLCLAFRGESSNALYQAWYDGSAWSGNGPIQIAPDNVPASTHGPALASYGGRLYAAFKAEDSNRLYFAWYDGATWQGNIQVETDHGFAESTTAPALHAFQGQLWMIFKAADSNRLYACVFDGTRWIGNTPIQSDGGTPESTTSPALATYNGALHLTFKAGDSSQLYSAHYDGAKWIGNTPIITDHGDATSPLAPWMAPLDGELMMLFKGDDSDYIYLAGLLSSGWYGNERLSRTTPISPLTSAPGAIAPLGSLLVMVFKGADSNQLYFATCSASL